MNLISFLLVFTCYFPILPFILITYFGEILSILFSTSVTKLQAKLYKNKFRDDSELKIGH